MDIWVVSTCWILWIICYEQVCTSWRGHVFPFLLGVYVGADFLSHHPPRGWCPKPLWPCLTIPHYAVYFYYLPCVQVLQCTMLSLASELLHCTWNSMCLCFLLSFFSCRIYWESLPLHSMPFSGSRLGTSSVCHHKTHCLICHIPCSAFYLHFACLWALWRRWQSLKHL